MTSELEALRSKGFGGIVAVVAALVSLLGCAGAWLAFALVVNYVATTLGHAGTH